MWRYSGSKKASRNEFAGGDDFDCHVSFEQGVHEDGTSSDIHWTHNG